ncbi:MAG: hopD2 2 [Gammaproteobacteria bacterium]|jgi:protein-tyrosine phosphatase|nr:hopD2 2 [Gammaproteobacteria bacterium]
MEWFSSKLKSFLARFMLKTSSALSPSTSKKPIIPSAENYQSCDASVNKPCIVQDTTLDNPMMNYRYLKSSFGLNLSGSGQPRITDWAKIGQGHAQKFDIDLRQESHGYLDGEAFTLYSENDWLNYGDNVAQAETAESAWLASLKTMVNIPNVLMFEQVAQKQFKAGKTIEAHLVQSEKEIAENAGFKYLRLAVPDHSHPSNVDVDSFVDAVTQNPDALFHIHCRQGIGRTTEFMAMFDMLKNADKLSFETIIDRQDKASYHDKELLKNNKDYYIKRYQFLQAFYLYAKARKLNQTTTPWSTSYRKYY